MKMAMKSSNLPDDFYLSLTEFLLHAKQQIVSISADMGLSSMQALTLLLVSTGQPRPMNSLGKLYDCDASNITGIIDGLEQKGLVSRRPHPSDRRIKIIRLEPAGLELRQAIANRLSSESHNMFNGLGETELRQLALLIHKVADTNRSATCPITKVSHPLVTKLKQPLATR
jgi:DNA-binding MarR family transcriptional regulator